MFAWLRRLFNIGKAEAHAALDKLEDPVKISEQGIRDMKTDLNKSLQGLAEVKAMSIRGKKELEESMRAAAEYENKAVLLLQKAASGEISEAEADRLAAQALAKKDQLIQRVQHGKKDVEQYEQMVSKMEANVQKLKSQISTWENEVKTLKARSKVSEASAKLNKQLAQVDSNDTLARLERMKEKVLEQEALAESYADLANANTSVDDEIDKVLGNAGQLPPSDALQKLKERLAAGEGPGMGKSEPAQGEGPGSGGSGGPLSELEKLKQQLRQDKENSGGG